MRSILISAIGLSIAVLSTSPLPQSTVPEGAIPAPVLPAVQSSSGNSGVAIDRSPSPKTSAEKPELVTRTRADEGLRIGGGDLIQVSVYGASDYAHDVRIAEDGTATLPLIGQVHAGGLTPRELASQVQQLLVKGGYFNSPQVSVFVKEYATQGVSVLGEVQKPGVYPLLGVRNLFDVLSAAQGTTPMADDKVYITHRGSPGQTEVVKLKYDEKGAAQSNVPVSPGDTIVVPKAGLVYVVGNVQKPTGIVMADPGLTVLKAIALAQGITPNAALDKAKLVRKTSDGQTAIPLKLKKMLAAEVPDIKVQPDDIIFVPNSVATSAFKKGLELALQTASGVLIYHQY